MLLIILLGLIAQIRLPLLMNETSIIKNTSHEYDSATSHSCSGCYNSYANAIFTQTILAAGAIGLFRSKPLMAGIS